MASNPNLKRLNEAGVSIWLDTLSRELLQSGEFAELIREFSVTGATSNPTIFAKAITGSDLYDGELRRLADTGQGDLRELFFARSRSTMCATLPARRARRSMRPAAGTGSSRSSARPTSRTTPTARSLRRLISGSGSTTGTR